MALRILDYTTHIFYPNNYVYSSTVIVSISFYLTLLDEAKIYLINVLLGNDNSDVDRKKLLEEKKK